MISERVDHVIQRVQSSFQNVEFSGYNMKFSSMLHLGVCQYVDFLGFRADICGTDQIGDEFLVGCCNWKG